MSTIKCPPSKYRIYLIFNTASLKYRKYLQINANVIKCSSWISIIRKRLKKNSYNNAWTKLPDTFNILTNLFNTSISILTFLILFTSVSLYNTFIYRLYFFICLLRVGQSHPLFLCQDVICTALSRVFIMRIFAKAECKNVFAC